MAAVDEIRLFVVGPIGTNCYALVSDGECMVVDPGSQGSEVARELADVHVSLIVATHGHGDHIGGVAALQRATGAPFAMCADDVELARHPNPMHQLPADEAAPEPDRLLVEGDVVTVGSASFTVFSAPGHTPGGIVLLGEGRAFVGDTIFQGACGRCDLPGGDWATMQRTLARLKGVIPAETRLLCGHGPATTMQMELASNPFMQ